MKKKAITRKVTVKNGRFLAAVRDAAVDRKEFHAEVIASAQSSGVIRKVLEANKKIATE